MHNLILGKRNATAQQRILENSGWLATHYGIDPALVAALKIQEKDPLVRSMKEREAVADLLDAISLKLGLVKPAAEETAPVTDGAAVDGLPEPVVSKAKGKK